MIGAGKFGLRTSRLLPITIGAMLILMGVKAIGLVRAATPEAPPVAASHKPAPPPVTPPIAVAPTQVVPKPAEISDSERGLLLDLRRRRGELEAREAALASRDVVLSATEKRLNARVDELASLQSKLEALEQARQARDAQNWQGLVKLYEAMKPRDAAAIFNDLDKPVLLAVLDRMKDGKAAAVLAAMAPDRARQATADLARQRTQSNTPQNATIPAAATQPAARPVQGAG
jgi:flagellar motility protein MotE (MotC chaperone)